MDLFITRRGGGGGGGGLNFQVVGGTTRPANPAENTIWVNTGTEITGWSFSQTEPAEPIANMVWFFVSHSQAAVNAITENEIMLYPSKAYQYNEGTWVSTPAFTYKDGSWHNWAKYIYYRGDSCVDVSGGWDATPTSCLTSFADRAYVNMANSYQDHYVYTGKAIDFSDANVLTLVVDVETTYTINFRITSSSYNGAQVLTHSISTAGMQTIELDVSGIDGSYYISFFAHLYNANTSNLGSFVRFNLYELYLT